MDNIYFAHSEARHRITTWNSALQGTVSKPTLKYTRTPESGSGENISLRHSHHINAALSLIESINNDDYVQINNTPCLV